MRVVLTAVCCVCDYCLCVLYVQFVIYRLVYESCAYSSVLCVCNCLCVLSAQFVIYRLVYETSQYEFQHVITLFSPEVCSQ